MTLIIINILLSVLIIITLLGFIGGVQKHLNSQKDDEWRIKMIAIVFWFLMFVALMFEINT
jgi:hypothetical protein